MQHESLSVKVDYEKIYVIQVKNGIMINVEVNVKNWLIEVLVNKVTGGTLLHV